VSGRRCRRRVPAGAELLTQLRIATRESDEILDGDLVGEGNALLA
jgi:hypothetical protein